MPHRNKPALMTSEGLPPQSSAGMLQVHNRDNGPAAACVSVCCPHKQQQQLRCPQGMWSILLADGHLFAAGEPFRYSPCSSTRCLVRQKYHLCVGLPAHVALAAAAESHCMCPQGEASAAFRCISCSIVCKLCLNRQGTAKCCIWLTGCSSTAVCLAPIGPSMHQPALSACLQACKAKQCSGSSSMMASWD